MIEFSSKVAGSFTGELVVATDQMPLPDSLSLIAGAEGLPELRPGRYRVGFAMVGRDRWWHLKDEAADEVALLAEIYGANHRQPLVFAKQPGHWYADSYELGLDATIDDAIDDFCSRFATAVVPGLALGG